MINIDYFIVKKNTNHFKENQKIFIRESFEKYLIIKYNLWGYAGYKVKEINRDDNSVTEIKTMKVNNRFALKIWGKRIYENKQSI